MSRPARRPVEPDTIRPGLNCEISSGMGGVWGVIVTAYDPKTHRATVKIDNPQHPDAHGQTMTVGRSALFNPK